MRKKIKTNMYTYANTNIDMNTNSDMNTHKDMDWNININLKTKINSRKLISLLLAIILLTFALSSCRPPKTNVSSSENSQANSSNNLTIVTSFYPVYVNVINVTNGISNVKVINMTSAQTGCLHDYQLKPQDVKSLEKADAFVINGAGMESFISDILSQRPGLKVIDTSKGVSTLKDSDGSINPHVWVSISNAMIQVKTIADELSLLDPANAIEYKKNSSLYLSKLNTLRTSAQSELSKLKTRDIITFHEAFPYFAKEFNLNILAVIEREPGSAPTAKELEETISIVKTSKAKALFAEPQYTSKAALTIAQATGAKVYILDPVVTGDATLDAIDNYIIVMRKNVQTLKEALG